MNASADSAVSVTTPTVSQRLYRMPNADERWIRRTERTLAGVAIVLAGCAPLFLSVHGTLLAGQALILTLFALSLNLLVGTTGLMSFGHAAYYGFGAFAERSWSNGAAYRGTWHSSLPRLSPASQRSSSV